MYSDDFLFGQKFYSKNIKINLDKLKLLVFLR